MAVFDTDIDECSEGLYECPNDTVCINTQGSHQCQNNEYGEFNNCNTLGSYRMKRPPFSHKVQPVVM